MAGKTKRSGDWDREGHIRVHLNIEQQQFSQPPKEITNARPRGLRIWYNTLYPSTSLQMPNIELHYPGIEPRPPLIECGRSTSELWNLYIMWVC